MLRDFAAGLDMAAHRRKAPGHFSGTLRVDELHLGRFTLLPATDPPADPPVAFAPVAGNDQGHMRRFLKDPRTWGLAPDVVVTDGSNLYPAVPAESWPGAGHQLCASHVLKDINRLALDAVRRLRTAMTRRGQAGRKEKRGRKGAKARARAARRGLTVEEEARFVFKRRHLVVTRREDLTEPERDDLTRMLESLPELATSRRFADRIYGLLDTPEDAHQASCRRAAVVRDPGFRAVPELAEALEQLDVEGFAKLMAYLEDPVGRRARTNNHVERIDRMIRSLEEVRDKWRRRRALARFVVVTPDAIRRGWAPAEAKGPNAAKPIRDDTTRVHHKRRSRQVA